MPDEIIAGHLTHWRLLGQGARPVLALHCSLAHGGAWSGVAAALPELQVTAPDLPGHGQSAEPVTPQEGHATATAMAIALAERIAGGTPIDIFGHSYGATVALRLALARPDLVRSLVLIEPVLFALARDWPGYQAFCAQQQQLEQQIVLEPEAAATAFNGAWGAGTPFADLAPRQRDYMLARMKHVVGQNPVLIDDGAGMTVPGALEALSPPVLLLEGSASPEVVDVIQGQLAARLPQARRVVVQGANHMLPISHATVVADQIRTHLSQC